MISDETFKYYSKELTQTPVMTTKREREIANLINTTNLTKQERKQLDDEIVTGHLRYVVTEAGKLQFSGVEAADLISEGNYGLMQAINGFDWSKGLKFGTYARHWIRQSMLLYIYNNARTIRLPYNIVQELHRQVKALNESGKEMEGEYANLPSTTDLFAKMGNGEEDGTLLDVVKNESADDFEKQFIKRDLIDKMMIKLEKREQDVVKLLFGLDGEEMDCVEIGKKLNMHKENVRLIKIKALSKLQN